ncbi:PIN domain-containing protein [Candidatus Poribacteria bacterium]|nr:MAG: PIN domain-containing protein [Candidatus Poribacteria bacterium]
MQTAQAWKIYLDTCCLNRLFDPQIQVRIRQETEAVDIILARIVARCWDWIASSVLEFEIFQNPDLEQRSDLKNILRFAHETVLMGTSEVARGEYLETLGFKYYDALHIACAESGGSDILLTTDDRMLRLAKRHSGQLRVRCENPHTWLQEVNANEHMGYDRR